MGRTLPYPKIHPKRPTASLVSKKVLTSIIGQIVINSVFQIVVFVWVRQQPWCVIFLACHSYGIGALVAKTIQQA